MSKILLNPSMMCADFSNLQKEVDELEEAAIDIFHIDIMDGQFVPNYGMGLQDLEYIVSATDKLVDIHLMTMNPGNYVEKFADLGVDIIYIHPEADMHAARTLDKIKMKGKKAGIAINPGTSMESVKELLPLIDYIMIMTVNPGFSGQTYLEYVNPKIEKAVKLGKKHGFEVMVDGAISEEKIYELSKIGVKGFILGTSTLFMKEKKYSDIIKNIRNKTQILNNS